VATRSRSLLTGATPLAIFLALFQPGASARDHEFRAVVKAVETTYHVRRNNRFAGWLAGMAVKVAHPEGIKSLRVAIFEDQDFSPRVNGAGLENAIGNRLSDDWRPIVRVRSRRDGEIDHIYARDKGKDVELYIVSVDEREAVVLKVRMDQAKYAEMLDHPANIVSSFCRNREGERSPEASQEIAERSSSLHRADSFTASSP
jgi:hypothetical protein